MKYLPFLRDTLRELVLSNPTYLYFHSTYQLKNSKGKCRSKLKLKVFPFYLSRK